MLSKVLNFMVAAVVVFLAHLGTAEACTFKGIALHGKVKIVSTRGDIKVKVVDHFQDLKVKTVSNFPRQCGEWQFVDSFPDFTIEFVDHFPDLKIKFVDHFPGV